MNALIFIFFSAAGDRAEAWGQLTGFIIGFVLTLLIGLAIVAEVKKRKKKKEEAEARSQDVAPPPNPIHK